MNWLIFVLLAVVALVCALIATHAARKCSAQLAEATSLATSLSRERGSIAALGAEFDALGTAFAKLSGRVAALKRWDQANREPLADPTTDFEPLDAQSARSELPPLPKANDIDAARAFKAKMRAQFLVKPTR